MQQNELAKKLGCRPSHLSEIETGKKYPSIEMLWEIEKHIGPVWANL
jgi:transcriptional regulator with XRE-family HTH domain